jgi:hypothetical protein
LATITREGVAAFKPPKALVTERGTNREFLRRKEERSEIPKNMIGEHAHIKKYDG